VRVLDPGPGPNVQSRLWVLLTHNSGFQAAVLLVVRRTSIQAYLLGLLAKIKCSICSNQLNL
jgi:hypothetical protein